MNSEMVLNWVLPVSYFLVGLATAVAAVRRLMRQGTTFDAMDCTISGLLAAMIVLFWPVILPFWLIDHCLYELFRPRWRS